MNVLFLTMAKMDSLQERGIYQDLMNEFRNNGHHLYIISPIERREDKNTFVSVENGVTFLNVKTLNIQKTNIIEKGVGTLLIEPLFLKAIKKHFNSVKFDLIVYSTPPITLLNVVKHIKFRDSAKTYLLLKDIFPQNAVDLKMIKKKSFLYRFFRKKEKQLYEISDTIGCMSPANVQYILKHNSEISADKVEVNPNSINPVPIVPVSKERRKNLKDKFQIPEDAKIFIYGGNLGKPQGLSYLLKLISDYQGDQRIFFLVIGSGTEKDYIRDWFMSNKPQNARFIEALPKKDYDEMVQISDVGMIFLHKDFTIPNFPSRLLSYLENSLPVLAVTDPNTDIGKIVEEANAGFRVIAGDREVLAERIEFLLKNNLDEMKKCSKFLLYNEYLVEKSYNLIIEKLN